MNEQPSTDRYYSLDPHTCYFCGKPNADDQSTYYSDLKKKPGSNAPGPQSVSVPVPRCNSCKAIHGQGNIAIKVSLVVGTLAGAGIGALLGDGVKLMIVLYGLVGGLVGALIGLAAKVMIAKGKGIKNSDDLNAHPGIADLMKQGYTKPRMAIK